MMKTNAVVASKGACTLSPKLSYAFYFMLAMDSKMQKIEPGPFFFYDGRKFQKHCINVIDTICTSRVVVT